MNKFYFVFILLLNWGNLYASNDSPPAIITTGIVNSLGKVKLIPAGSHIRLVNFSENFDKWYHEVELLDENDQPRGLEPLKVSQYYTANQFAKTLNSNQTFLNPETGKEISISSGRRFIIVKSSSGSWQYYAVQFIDEDGTGVDHKGNPTSSAKLYKISKQYLDSDQLRTSLEKYQVVQDIVERTGIQEQSCPPNEEVLNVENEKVGDSEDSSYIYLKQQRAKLREKGTSKCMIAKQKIEMKFLESDESSYKGLTLDQRAEKIYTDAKAVHQAIIKSGGTENKKSSKSSYLDFVNGNYIDPILKPEIVSCIAYQETKGSLNPYAVNYTLCNKTMSSTAHGLGQMTRSTLSNMMDNPDGKLVPLNTPISKKYAGLSATKIHSSMSSDPQMQLEVLLRLMNANIKFVRWKHKGLSEKEILKRAVVDYDRDQESKYIKNVFNKCLPCFEKKKKASECHKNFD